MLEIQASQLRVGDRVLWFDGVESTVTGVHRNPGDVAVTVGTDDNRGGWLNGRTVVTVIRAEEFTPTEQHLVQLKHLAKTMAELVVEIADETIPQDRWHDRATVILNQAELLQAWTAPRFMKAGK